MQLNKKKQLERIIHFTLYELMQEIDSNFFSASNVKISEKGDSVRIYLNFVQPQEKEKIISFLQKKKWYFKRKIAQAHCFSRIPLINFFSDKQLMY